MADAPEEQLCAATALGERPASEDASNLCPVCRRTVAGHKAYIKHVGRHLEQLALFALPPVEYDNATKGHQETDDEESEDPDASLPAPAEAAQESNDSDTWLSSFGSAYGEVCRLLFMLRPGTCLSSAYRG